MAIYHLHLQTIGRDKGRSAIAAAAYRAGCVLSGVVLDRGTGISQSITFDYSQKGNVLHSEILAPAHAPEWIYDRQALWSAVETISIRKDARFAREIDVAIPIEFDPEQAISFMRDFVQTTFVEKGMVADYSIHWEQGNPHAHIMLTTRDITVEGLGKVNEDWNRKEFLFYVRERCRDVANLYLERYGYEDRIDHRSYKDQGIAILPTIHEGVAAREMEADGIVTEVLEVNTRVQQQNQQLIEAYPDTIIDVIAARKASFTEADMAREIFKRVEGDEASFQYVFDKVRHSKRLLKLPHRDINGNARFAEARYAKAENALWEGVRVLQERTGHSITASFSSSQLSEEQQRAACSILEGGDISVLIGRAGTGKTTLLRNLAEQYSQQGYRVIGGAISGIATENLSQEAGIASRTLAGWQLRWQHPGGGLSHKDIFIIDEASMVDTVQMQQCVQAVRDAGAKLVLVGDHDQIQPIGPGEAFRGITAQLGAALIATVWRQKEAWQRKATEQMAMGDINQALSSYEEQGGVLWHDSRDAAVRGLVTRYLTDISHTPDKSRIILAYTNREIARINQMVRVDMKEAGLLRQEQEVRTAYGMLAVSVGEKLVFLKNDRKLGLQNGTMATLLGIKGDTIEVQLDGRVGQGKTTLQFSLQDYNAFSYGYAVTTHKAQGITVDESYLLVEKHFNLNTAYVSMSRHREKLQLFVDHETYADEKALLRTLERRPENSLVSDYSLTEKNQPYYDNVRSYREKAKQASALYQAMHYWAVSENVPVPTHSDWKAFMACKTERDNLAKIICAEAAAHRIFLRQARITPNAVEIHAGLRTPTLLQEQQEAKAVVQAYSRAGKEEAATLADRISHHLPLYSRYLREANIEHTQLQQDAALFTARALEKQQAEALSLTLPEQWAVYKSLEESNKQEAASTLHSAVTAAIEERDYLLAQEQQYKQETSSQQDSIAQADYQEFLAEEKLGRIYRHGQQALQHWQSLSQQHGADKAVELVQENPSLLGKLQGASLLGILTTTERRKAVSLTLSLHSQLQKLETTRQQKEAALHTLKHYQDSQRATLIQEKIALLELHLGWIKDHARAVTNPLEKDILKTQHIMQEKPEQQTLSELKQEYTLLEEEALTFSCISKGMEASKTTLVHAESMQEQYKRQAAADYIIAETALHKTFKDPTPILTALQAGEWEVALHLMAAAKHKQGFLPLSNREKEHRLFTARKAIEPYKQASNSLRDNEKKIILCSTDLLDYAEQLQAYEKTATNQQARQQRMEVLERKMQTLSKTQENELTK